MGTTIKNTLYKTASKALKYKLCTLSQFDFLPENQRVSLFAEHRMMVIIEHANMFKGKKWVIHWKDWSQQKWRNWYQAVTDTSKTSGVGFVFCNSFFDYGSAKNSLKTCQK
jgi:hypothetical protein